ncbi:MAG: tRNA guanosine(34) transglycosylase Tgt [Bacteroidales bacterium]
MKFTISHNDSQSSARAGVVETEHGDIQTPIFMPVGTLGAVKGVHTRELDIDIQAQIILGNTYHLYLRPGLDVIKNAGGLHSFMGWDKPILTDSGGYQVFSLTAQRKLTEEGAVFKSHIDGSKHVFTPENVVDFQRIIGSDICMALDECTPYPCDYSYAKSSMNLTHRWLERGVRHFKQTKGRYGYSQTFFPIVQGSVYKDLRAQSAEFIAQQDMEGNAIGGLSVGEPIDDMYEMLDVVNGILPKEKPRYLMGVGTPVNILEAIALGTDMFDCVMPTRNGRNGMMFTWNGIVNLKNKKWQQDFSCLDECGTSFVDSAYTKAYVRHLIHSGEMLGSQIISIHNLAFYLSLVKEARARIVEGDFALWKEKMVQQLAQRI